MRTKHNKLRNKHYNFNKKNENLYNKIYSYFTIVRISQSIRMLKAKINNFEKISHK